MNASRFWTFTSPEIRITRGGGKGGGSKDKGGNKDKGGGGGRGRGGGWSGGNGRNGITAPTPLAAPPIDAVHVAVHDITNTFILYEKAADTQSAPASLAKMATAILLMRNKSSVLDTESETITAADMIPGGSDAGLGVDDVTTYRHLLYGILLPSGNEAAECIARTIGTDIYIAAGSTGNTGVVRFVEAMNDLATEFGMTNTVFTNPTGIDTPAGNLTTANDLSVLCGKTYVDATLQTIGGTADHTMVITGVNSRSYGISHTSPQTDEDNVLSAKTGWTPDAEYGTCVYWNSPAGYKIAFTVMQSNTTNTRYLDMRGLIYQVVTDFPYLAGTVGTDADFASVILLTGGDSGFTDESDVGRTLTDNGVTRSTSGPLVGSHSYLFNGTSDHIETVDADDLSMGNSDFCVEFWIAGDGAEPAGSEAFVSKWDTTSNRREWTVQYDAGQNRIVLFVSTTGSDFPEAHLDLDTNGWTPNIFFNGAKRHILARRSGDEIALYVDGHKGAISPNLSAGIALHADTARGIVGARQSGGTGEQFFFNGKIDDVRITKGVPRQTAAAKFTPDGREYPRS